MNVWKCYSCQSKFTGLEPDMHCPRCKRLTQWVLVSVLSGGHVQETEEMQEMLRRDGKYELKHTICIRGSERPCRVPACAGQMYAYLHLYKDGGFRLIFTCDRCHSDHLPGLGTAFVNDAEAPSTVTALV